MRSRLVQVYDDHQRPVTKIFTLLRNRRHDSFAIGRSRKFEIKFSLRKIECQDFSNLLESNGCTAEYSSLTMC